MASIWNYITISQIFIKYLSITLNTAHNWSCPTDNIWISRLFEYCVANARPVIIMPRATEQIHFDFTHTYWKQRSPKKITREISHFFILKYLCKSAAQPKLSMMYPILNTSKLWLYIIKPWSYSFQLDLDVLIGQLLDLY